jgi:hypothetical protein
LRADGLGLGCADVAEQLGSDQGGQQADDDHDDQKFHQGETPSLFLRLATFMRLTLNDGFLHGLVSCFTFANR